MDIAQAIKNICSVLVQNKIGKSLERIKLLLSPVANERSRYKQNTLRILDDVSIYMYVLVSMYM